MAVSCSVIFDFAAAMLDVERFERGGYVLVVFIYIRVGSTARGGCVTGAAGEMNAASRGRPENSTLKQCCPVLLRRLASRCGAGTCWQLIYSYRAYAFSSLARFSRARAYAGRDTSRFA